MTEREREGEAGSPRRQDPTIHGEQGGRLPEGSAGKNHTFAARHPRSWAVTALGGCALCHRGCTGPPCRVVLDAVGLS